MTQLYSILKTSKLGAGAASDMYTALFAQKINKGGSGGEAELSGVPPLTFRSNGTPLLDLLISGNEEHSGTPSPTSPVMPQGTGERTGNLVLVSYDNVVYYTNYNQFTISDGTITVTGRMLIGFKVKVTPDTTYTVSAVYSTGKPLMRIREYTEIPDDWVNGFINQPVNTNDTSATFTTSSETEWILVAFYSEVVGITISNVMLNTGSTALPYEPFGVKIPISSASTTTPIYLGEVQSTRQIKKLVLTGDEEGWTIGTASGHQRATITLPAQVGEDGNGYCTHYKFVYAVKNGNAYIAHNFNMLAIIDDTNAVDKTTFLAYLAAQYAAGTPVTVWYVLATPETTVVNEPLMKIGDYADTVSKAQAGVTIPTNNGSTTVDVDTTVKPSEVYIKYHTR